MVVLSNYARSLRELHRLDEAADYADRAYAMAQRTGIDSSRVLLERARIYMAQHNPSRAGAVLEEVQAKLEKSLPPGHFAFGVLATDKALNALLQGDTAAAVKLADQGVSSLEATIKAGGEGSYYLPRLLVRRSVVELAAGRASDAAADARRAVDLLQPGIEPGKFSSHLGNAFLALGRALQAQGKREEARAAFRSAAENLQNTLGPDHPDSRQARQLAA